MSAGLTSCAVSPEPIEPGAHVERAQADLDRIQSLEFVPNRPVSLHEAVARAVSFNLKQRIKEIEREISEAELAHGNVQLLPRVELNAERRGSNSEITSSDDRIANTASAGLAWNVLDLGVSYARAKQSADRVLIARENERKALQDIVREVRTSYFRAAGAQRLMSRIQELGKDIKIALRKSHQAERARYQDAVTAAAYRREIVETVNESLNIQSDLRQAKAELAALLNIPQGVEFSLADTASSFASPGLPMSLHDMEEYALAMRPELRIEDYNERIGEWQSVEALYSMLPGLDLSFTRNYSSETTNLTPNWYGAGVRAGMKLIDLFSGSSKVTAAEKRAELARQQRMALSLAVLTQVNVAYIRFQNALKRSRLAREVADADRRLLLLVARDGNFMHTNYLETVKLAASQLQSEVKEHLTYVDVISAHGDLMHAVGFDVFPEAIDVGNIGKLTREVCHLLARWDVSGGATVRPVRDHAALRVDSIVDGMIAGFAAAEPAAVKRLAAAPDELHPSLIPRGSWRLDDLALRLVEIAPASGAMTPVPSERSVEFQDVRCAPLRTERGYIW